MGYFVSHYTNYLPAVLLFIKYWRMRSHAQQLLTLANETLENRLKSVHLPRIDQSKINTGDKRAQSG